MHRRAPPYASDATRTTARRWPTPSPVWTSGSDSPLNITTTSASAKPSLRSSDFTARARRSDSARLYVGVPDVSAWPVVPRAITRKVPPELPAVYRPVAFTVPPVALHVALSLVRPDIVLGRNLADQIVLDQVLMVSDGDAVKLGNPLVSGAKVSATVIAHGRGVKVKIFKMRRRKHYQKRQGHRQNFTEIEISAVNA